MTEDVARQRIAETLKEINTLPEEQRGPLLALYEETLQRHGELKSNVARLHEAFGEWRLTMKYLLFDREAARRERDELRGKLDDREHS